MHLTVRSHSYTHIRAHDIINGLNGDNVVPVSAVNERAPGTEAVQRDTYRYERVGENEVAGMRALIWRIVEEAFLLLIARTCFTYTLFVAGGAVSGPSGRVPFFTKKECSRVYSALASK